MYTLESKLLAIDVTYGRAFIDAEEKSVAKRTFLRNTLSFMGAGVFIRYSRIRSGPYRSPADTSAFRHLVPGMQDDLYPFVHSIHNFCLQGVPMSNFNDAGVCPTILHHKDAPVLSPAKQRTGGHFEHVVSFPDNDANVYSIAVTEPFWRIDEIHNNVNALFFHA